MPDHDPDSHRRCHGHVFPKSGATAVGAEDTDLLDAGLRAWTAPPARQDQKYPDSQLGTVEAMPANPLGVALRNRRAGHHTLVWARPDLQAPEFTLTSPAFDHGAPIPEKHRGRLFGANVSPALNWTQPPAGTVELVLIAQDPDVPVGKPATHALTLGIDPSLNGIPENALANPSPIPGLRHGKGPLGRRGWAGPMPIRSHGPHAYVFQLFALDQVPGLPVGFALDEVIAAMSGHIIGRARLDGTYEIR
ncbi:MULTISPECIES: YbhB/YbcL family Raf kinase inhibitor-like protein [Streptomyces]|uniref:YbhB/YbcL family Raf kinase inhibitor-like protein n=1 Tax=Streptomyces TaxID=1883 RepID=UPI002E17CB69|nr:MULTISPECIES: YbhB/YbcL family Raf kinase inhibitor-like protein [unclassified Streptomyces]